MGIVRSKLVRPVKTYNVEYRAHKIINQEKPKVAPYHPSVYEQIKVAKKVSPNFMEEHYKKDAELYDRLKQVFVSSNILGVPEHKPTNERPLPKSTRTPDVFEFGYWEPKQVPEGRCHLKEILTFLAQHLAKPEEYTAKKIAEEYKLDIKDVENVLEYYRVLQIITPERKLVTYPNPDENIGLPETDEQGNIKWKVYDIKMQEKENDIKAMEEKEMKDKAMKEKEMEKNAMKEKKMEENSMKDNEINNKKDEMKFKKHDYS